MSFRTEVSIFYLPRTAIIYFICITDISITVGVKIIADNPVPTEISWLFCLYSTSFSNGSTSIVDFNATEVECVFDVNQINNKTDMATFPYHI